MTSLTETIAAALAPGIALNSVIFYNTALQNRFTYIAGRIRELNREARELRRGGTVEEDPRLRSVLWQVDLMAHRSQRVLRAILIAYLGLGCFILTILGLLVAGVTGLPVIFVVPLGTFAVGLCALGTSVILSWTESRQSLATLMDDIRSSRAAAVGGVATTAPAPVERPPGVGPV
jgi:hypothetical protein